MKRIFFALVLFSLALAMNAQTSYADRVVLSQDPIFRGRVMIAAIESASEILADTSARSRLMHPFAGRIFTEPGSSSFIDMFVFATLTNPVVNAESTDKDLKFTVNSQFEKLDRQYRGQRNELTDEEQKRLVLPEIKER